MLKNSAKLLLQTKKKKMTTLLKKLFDFEVEILIFLTFEQEKLQKNFSDKAILAIGY